MFRHAALLVASIELTRPLAISLMPENLLTTLSREEILDLVADIESRGRSDYRLYRRGTEPGRKSNRPKSSRWTASTVLTIASCRL